MSKTNSDETEYTVVPIIPVDSLLHSEEYPFCYNPSCPCHEDLDLIAPINQGYQDGELSAQDASDIVKGNKI